MKTLFIAVSLLLLTTCAMAQYPIADSVRSDINAKIVTNGTQAITAAVLKKILIGLYNFSTDTAWVTGNTIYYRRGGITFPLGSFNSVITAPNTTFKYWNGYKQFVPLNTDSIPEGTNLFYTAARARQAFTALLPLTYNNITGIFGVDTVSINPWALATQFDISSLVSKIIPDTITAKKVLTDSLNLLNNVGINQRTTQNANVNVLSSYVPLVGSGFARWFGMYGDSYGSEIHMGANNPGAFGANLRIVGRYDDSLIGGTYRSMVLQTPIRLKFSAGHGLPNDQDTSIQFTTHTNLDDLAAIFRKNGQFVSYKGINAANIFSGSIASTYEPLTLRGNYFANPSGESIIFNNTHSVTPKRIIVYGGSNTTNQPVSIIPNGDGSLLVGADNSADNLSAVLNVVSNTRGAFLPRMSAAQRLAMSPGVGLLVFDTDSSSLFQFTLSGWQNLFNVLTSTGSAIVSMVSDTTALKASPAVVGNLLYLSDSIMSGFFRVSNTFSELPNGGTTFLMASGLYAKREISNSPHLMARWWGVNANGVYNNTVALQKAVDYSTSIITRKLGVMLPGGIIQLDSLNIRAGTELIGVSGMTEQLNRGGTLLRQNSGINRSLIVCYNDENSSSSQYFWYGRLANFAMLGHLSNTAGYGILFKQKNSDTLVNIQDQTVIENLVIRQFYQGGMFVKGAIPLNIHNVKAYFNNGPGFVFENVGSSRSSVNITMVDMTVSGDGNRGGLVFIKNYGQNANFKINAKSETRENPFNPTTLTGEQYNVITVDSCFKTVIHLTQAVCNASVDSLGFFNKPGDVFKVNGNINSWPRLYWNNVTVRVRTTDLGIDPVIVSGTTIPYTRESGFWNTDAPTHSMSDTIPGTHTFPSTGTVVFNGIVKMSSSTAPEIGTLKTIASVSNSNITWSSGTSISTSTDSKFLPTNYSGINHRIAMGMGVNSGTLTAGYPLAGVLIGRGPFTTPASGVIPYAANLDILPLGTITNGGVLPPVVTNLRVGLPHTITGLTDGSYSAIFKGPVKIDSAGGLKVGIVSSGPTTGQDAIVEIGSTTQGLFIPTMTTAQKNAIVSPRTGLLVFDATLGALSQYTAALGWARLDSTSSGGGVASVSNIDNTLTISPTSGAVVGSLNLSNANTWLETITVNKNSLGTTSVNGFSNVNTTSASNGSQQISPSYHLGSQGWGTTAGTSQSVEWRMNSLPVQSTVPSGTFQLQSSIAGGAWTNRMSVTTGGTLGNLGLINVSKTNLGASSADGMTISTSTMATGGVPTQWTPRFRWSGYGYDNVAAASHTVEFIAEVRPNGNISPVTGSLFFARQINTGGYVDLAEFKSNGNLVVGATNAIQGTATNNNATAGNIGEYVSSAVSLGTLVSLTNTTAANITSISLTAGDWDVEGHVNFNESGTAVTERVASINTVSATQLNDGTESHNSQQSVVTGGGSAFADLTITRKRISISSTTTVYLIGTAYFPSGTVGGFGSITARRVR